MTKGLIGIVRSYIYDSLLPANLNKWYNMGSCLGILILLQILTGIFLGMFYKINFDSIEYIMREVQYGWLIRYTHANIASFLFICLYIHIFRGLRFGSYIGIRKKLWFFGVCILIIMIITAFLGYTLVWGSMSYWAATVITNLITTIPIIGQDIVEWIWGGFTVGEPTLNRFYALHYILPFIIVGLILAHLIALHENGSTNPLGILSNKWVIKFHPYYTFKDIYIFFILFFLLAFIISYYPNILGHTDNYIEADPLVTPSHITPEWYLLSFYALLRSIPNKLFGVIIMLSGLLVFFILPYLNNSLTLSVRFRPLYHLLLLSFLFNWFLLSFIGQAIVSQPYIFIGQLSTFYYFFSLTIGIYFISFIELFLFLI